MVDQFLSAFPNPCSSIQVCPLPFSPKRVGTNNGFSRRRNQVEIVGSHHESAPYPTASDGAEPVEGLPIDGERICSLSRTKLQKFFQRSDCGRNSALFETYFIKGSHPPKCLMCGKSIPFHAASDGDSRDESAPHVPEPPRARLRSMDSSRDHPARSGTGKMEGARQGLPIDGEVLCPLPRTELQKVFERSDCGRNTALFETYFVKGSHPPKCQVCGKLIPFHAASNESSGSRLATTQQGRNASLSSYSSASRDAPEGSGTEKEEDSRAECPVTRKELRRVFNLSKKEKNDALFEASFVKGSNPPRCLACGELMHVHLSRTSVSTEVQSETILDRQSAAIDSNSRRILCAAPQHWRDSVFRVLSYYNFKELDREQNPAEVVWQCAAAAEGLPPCNHALAAGSAYGTFHEDEVLALKAHLIEAHRIDVDSSFKQSPAAGPGQWSTSLFGCLVHPRSCVDCLCCYPFGISWCFPQSDTFDECMSRRLNRLTKHESEESTLCIFCQPFVSQPTLVVNGYNPELRECCWNGDLAIIMLSGGWALWLAISLFVGGTQALTSIFTLCGLPCQGMPPALLNDCYQHRRYLVEQEGIPESHLQSKLITLFCWPCSECQVWREFQSNGIWPGLCLCVGSDTDKAGMEPPNVRRALDQRIVPPIGPSPMGSPWTAKIFFRR
jgi:hypothetical protein